jgi:glyoxylase-like metal-dependent hydrolase (beta-lactamase superfamily II)
MSASSTNGVGSTKPVRVADGVYSLRQWMGGHVHAYLVDDGNGLTLIDTLYDKDGGRVLRAIRDIGRQVTDVKNILISHAHRSHIGGVAALKKLSGAKVWVHEWEADILAGDRKAQACTIIPQPPILSYPYQFGLAIGVGKHPPCEPDGFFREGDRIGPLQIIYTPGHSPGHMAFYWDNRSFLHAGDAIATWPDLRLGWPALNLNKKQHLQSLRKVDDLRVDVIAVGHGDAAVGDQIEKLRRMIRSGKE